MHARPIGLATAKRANAEVVDVWVYARPGPQFLIWTLQRLMFGCMPSPAPKCLAMLSPSVDVETADVWTIGGPGPGMLIYPIVGAETVDFWMHAKPPEMLDPSVDTETVVSWMYARRGS